MIEADYKADIVNFLEYHGFHVETHEDKHNNYIPDLSAAGRGKHIWIEVKYADKVPKSLSSIPHYTRGQQNWLVRRAMAQGGGTFLWLGTPTDHFIWAGLILPDVRYPPIIPNSARRALAWDSSFVRAAGALLRRL